MRYLTSIVIFFCFCLPFSVFSQDSFVGDWQLSVPMEDGQTFMVNMSILDGDVFTVDIGNDGTIDVNGEYKVSGDQMTIKGISGPGVKCKEEGIYKFEFKDNTMTMTRVTDPCSERGGPDGIMVFKRV